MNNYIYIYLDPRKSGKYCYSNICFLYEPMYIGKGSNYRYKKSDNRNKYFKNKINKIKQSGLEPIVFKLYENLNEEKSFELEKKLIQEIGRFNLKTGTLVNMTIGGEGIGGYTHLDISKKNMSKNRTGVKNPNFGKHRSEETRKKISESNKGKILSEEIKNKISEKQKGKYHSEKTRKKISENHSNTKGENNPNHKLTEEQVIQIKLLLKDGKLTHKEIADIFGVSRITISCIKNNKIWSYIKLGDING